MRQYCIHAEPNYGVLWFYFKNSILDNAVDIWENARLEFLEQKPKNGHSDKQEYWIASQRLIKILRSGMQECRDVEEKLKIVYGFEQVLPPASAYL